MKAYTYRTAADFQAAFKLLAKLEHHQAKQAAKLKERISALQAKHEAARADDVAEIAAIRAGLAAYATAHREELTGKGKTVAMPGGCIKWRKSPAKVEISGDMAAVLAALKRRRLSRFIRVKEEINKAALLKEAGAIKTPIDGLEIVAGEEKLLIETGA